MRSFRTTVAIVALLTVPPHFISSVDAPRHARRPVALGRAIVVARSFLHEYVDRSGRVVRRDQGGDTVSEGQAYAMLLAVAVHDASRFAQVWSWTATNLQRPDGLLSWHWNGGRVIDSMPATDADLDTAHALALASTAFGQTSYAADAARIGDAVLAEETLALAGRLVLVAGPWARQSAADGSPVAVVNPSYFSPRAYTELDRLMGDPRWGQLRASAVEQIGALTTNALPPDWATVDSNGVVQPAPAPGASRIGYGADAARVPPRFAEACDPASRVVAASLWPRLRHAAHRSTIGFVAAAAGAAAARVSSARDALLDSAERSEARHSTYYGSAWVGLGRVLLTTHLLGGCPA